MKWSSLAFLLLILAGVGSLRADQTTATVQQALKEQGFYYGAVNGQKTADTTAALRRYQIRNGLQINGEIDAETLRSLGVGGSGSASARPQQPSRVEEEPADDDDGQPSQSAEINPPQAAPNYAPQRVPAPNYAPGPNNYGPGPGSARPELAGGVFAGTPYELAPADLQRHVIVGAQTLLARQGLYRSGIDGEFGHGTSAAVRGFQARAGLSPSGRLNMETLAALGLLPGQRVQRYSTPVRRLRPRPIYRGQWVPDR
ncbi:MAG: peptidoglycan-binding domain-containing protein [Chthoniobacterales bacterium]